MLEQVIDHLHTRTYSERYQERMDSSLPEKLNVAKDAVAELLSRQKENNQEKRSVLSIGAGSGSVEAALARKGLRVIAVDLSYVMLETIHGKAHELELEAEDHPNEIGEVIAVQARAEALPTSRVDMILCLSVIHEIASFGLEFDFEKSKEFFKHILENLKKDGYIVIRDFMQPEEPNKMVTLRLGKAEDNSDLKPPLEFIEYFAEKFEGDDTTDLRRQILTLKEKDRWKTDARLYVPNYLAMETIAHYSWRSSPEEIKEKYAYLPLSEYVTFIHNIARDNGIDIEIKKQEAVAQPGYDVHTRGQIDIIDEQNIRQSLPPWTGGLVIQRKS